MMMIKYQDWYNGVSVDVGCAQGSGSAVAAVESRDARASGCRGTNASRRSLKPTLNKAGGNLVGANHKRKRRTDILSVQ